MPNRILRDWTDSEPIESISWQAEVLFTRLLMKADDFGRFHADPCMLRASLFPRRLDKVREADISRWIAECEKSGLIVLYEAGGKTYLEIPKFGQTVRATKSKFPDACAQNDSTCEQVQADAHVFVDVDVGAISSGEPKKKLSSDGDYHPEFESWWKSYPTRKGAKHGKRASFREWKLIAETERESLNQATLAYAARCNGFPKDPERFLKGEIWRDYVGTAEDPKQNRVATDEDLKNYSPF